MRIGRSEAGTHLAVVMVWGWGGGQGEMDARMGGQLRPQKMELDSILDLRWDDFGSPDPHDKEMWGGGLLGGSVS